MKNEYIGLGLISAFALILGSVTFAPGTKEQNLAAMIVAISAAIIGCTVLFKKKNCL